MNAIIMNTIIAVGQRWRYLAGRFDMIAEIIILYPEIQTKILMANEYSIQEGYPVDRVKNHMGIGETYDWQYLEGQDKPLC